MSMHAEVQSAESLGRTLPDLGTLSEEGIKELFRPRVLLGEYADEERVSNASLLRRA